MEISYKRLTENELDWFISMRINQLREEGARELNGILILNLNIMKTSFSISFRIRRGYTPRLL